MLGKGGGLFLSHPGRSTSPTLENLFWSRRTSLFVWSHGIDLGQKPWRVEDKVLWEGSCAYNQKITKHSLTVFKSLNFSVGNKIPSKTQFSDMPK